MKLLFVAGRELTYTRNDVILRALRRFCEVDAIGVVRRPRSLLVNSLLVFLRAAPLILTRRYDLIYVGFYGHLLVLLIRLITRKPILFDAFISTFDTLGGDRQLFSRRSVPGKAAFWLDRRACQVSTHVLLDTPRQVHYFINTFRLPDNQFSAVPVSCNEEIFYPRPAARQGGQLRILFYCSYLPLHGANIVVQAAKLVQDLPVSFRLIGNGQTFQEVKYLAVQAGLANVEFIQPIPLLDLPVEIAAADICLGGPFGRSEKAGRVIPGKIYQVLAMQKPLIAACTVANLELLEHGRSACLCRPDDAEDLAKAIATLADAPELREKLAEQGYHLYRDRCSEAQITAQLGSILSDLDIQG